MTAQTSRRTLLGAATAAGATLATGVPGTAAAATGTARAAAADLVAVDPLLHLLRRATYGPTPASIAEIRSLGAARWLDRQLNPASIADDACAALVARFPLAGRDVTAVRAAASAGVFKTYGWEAMFQLGTAAVTRAIWSNRQLFEAMVDFWSNHLNVTCPNGDVWDSRPDYDVTVIRRHALGRFADMLKASARHPAMLTYLDNRYSTKAKPNENYARELLELHTVGLGAHGEPDVRQAALLLTGATVNTKTGLYRYDPAAHATGAITVLGFSHPNADPAGEPAVTAFLDYLATHPATAERIARKLCVRFVADEPPASLVTTLAKVYLANGTAIAPVLRALFTSAEFAASAGRKQRTPLEDLAATVRTLGFGPDASGTAGLTSLYWALEPSGHQPMAWAPPNGYPDVAAAWASPSGLLTRWNLHMNLAANWWYKQLTRPASLRAALVPTVPATYGGLVDALALRLFGTKLAAAHTTALAAYFGKSPGSALKSTDPAVNANFPYLVALLLDSPYFLVR
ncbi:MULTISPECIES: DUF1800 domain-containing protein [Catenuloplanes]|uniref:Uncharacterized protein (DUF1800 family) n=1 Tax=Catenuloplanes niger TaxID=587534 RepID=A0AAE3ZV37_9ACTN|nr:DUF1800 domain-containing protein [Catenuloplanes niger]MDR7324450.1 uncharacterized protein (DUF1800 family) [Catenuloplanes niger]